MHNRMIILLPLLAFLTHCSTNNPNSGSGTSTLPVLSSPARAKAWGAPQIVPTKDGYKMTYTNPANDKERVTITGSRELMFFLYYPPNLKGTRMVEGTATKVDEAQLWKTALIAGQKVKWYHAHLPSANYGNIFRTLGAELKDGAGNAGHYRIEVEGTKNQMQSWLSELEFDPK